MSTRYLLFAACNNDFALARLYFNDATELCACDFSGRNNVHWAVYDINILMLQHFLTYNGNYHVAYYQGMTPKQLASDNAEIHAILDVAIERLANSPAMNVLPHNAPSSWANYWSVWSFFSRRNNTASSPEAQPSYFSRLPNSCTIV